MMRAISRLGAGPPAYAIHTTPAGFEIVPRAADESTSGVRLREQMHERFPGIASDWFANVMLPAFERREAVLYERPVTAA